MGWEHWRHPHLRFSRESSPIHSIGLQGRPYIAKGIHELKDSNSSSCVVSTERTILSPFTKEYRVHATISNIPQFLEGAFLSRKRPTNSNIQILSFSFRVSSWR
ncbi:hypothetical protein PVAP13_6KG284418 [Panicum virgatum]|uniref:Uncharacterized protein n=1 Tax=Panicum virgatum TaxID=38727 RepID=A0A8T0RE90_PANVG|nr:hypothetical protein PVAP13_6KG284418 [Panicum virgatum]